MGRKNKKKNSKQTNSDSIVLSDDIGLLTTGDDESQILLAPDRRVYAATRIQSMIRMKIAMRRKDDLIERNTLEEIVKAHEAIIEKASIAIMSEVDMEEIIFEKNTLEEANNFVASTAIASPKDINIVEIAEKGEPVSYSIDSPINVMQAFDSIEVQALLKQEKDILWKIINEKESIISKLKNELEDTHHLMAVEKDASEKLLKEKRDEIMTLKTTQEEMQNIMKLEKEAVDKLVKDKNMEMSAMRIAHDQMQTRVRAEKNTTERILKEKIDEINHLRTSQEALIHLITTEKKTIEAVLQDKLEEVERLRGTQEEMQLLMKHDHDAFDRQLKERQSEMERLKFDNSKLREDSLNVERQLRERGEIIDRMKRSNDENAGLVEKLQFQLVNVQRELEEERQKVLRNETKSEVDTHEMITDLHNRYSESQAIKFKLEKELSRAVEDQDTQRSAFQSCIREMEARILSQEEELKRREEGYERELREKSEQVLFLRNSCETLVNAETDGKQKLKTKMMAALEAVQAEYKHMKDSLEQKNRDLLGELEFLQMREKTLLFELEASNIKTTEMAVDLEAKLQQRDDEIAQMRDYIRKLEYQFHQRENNLQVQGQVEVKGGGGGRPEGVHGGEYDDEDAATTTCSPGFLISTPTRVDPFGRREKTPSTSSSVVSRREEDAFRSDASNSSSGSHRSSRSSSHTQQRQLKNQSQHMQTVEEQLMDRLSRELTEKNSQSSHVNDQNMIALYENRMLELQHMMKLQRENSAKELQRKQEEIDQLWHIIRKSEATREELTVSQIQLQQELDDERSSRSSSLNSSPSRSLWSAAESSGNIILKRAVGREADDGDSNGYNNNSNNPFISGPQKSSMKVRELRLERYERSAMDFEKDELLIELTGREPLDEILRRHRDLQNEMRVSWGALEDRDEAFEALKEEFNEQFLAERAAHAKAVQAKSEEVEALRVNYEKVVASEGEVRSKLKAKMLAALDAVQVEYQTMKEALELRIRDLEAESEAKVASLMETINNLTHGLDGTATASNEMIQELQTKLKKCDEDVLSVTSAMGMLESKLKEKEEALDMHKLLQEKLVRNLQEQSQDKSEEIKACHNQITELHKQEESLREQILQIEGEKKEVEKLFERKTEETEGLYAKVERLERMEREFENLKVVYNSTRDDLEKMRFDFIPAGENRKANSREIIQDLRARLKVREEALEVSRRRELDLESELLSCRRTLEERDNMLERTMVDMHKVSVLEAKSVERAYQAKCEEIEVLRSNYGEMQATIEEMVLVEKDLRAQIEASSAAHASLQAKAKAERESLLRDLSQATSMGAMGELRNYVLDIGKKVCELEKELLEDSKKGENQTASDDPNEGDEAGVQREEDSHYSRNVTDRLDDLLYVMKTRMYNLQQNILEQKGMRTASENTIKKQNGEIEKLELVIEELRQQNETLIGSNLTLRAQLEDSISKYDIMHLRWKRERENHNEEEVAELNNLRSSYRACQEELKKVSTEYQVKDKFLSELQNSLIIKDEDLQNLKTLLKSKDENYNSISSKLKLKEDVLINLKTTLKQKDEIIENLNAFIKQRESEGSLDDLKNELESVKKTLAFREEDIRAKAYTISTLEYLLTDVTAREKALANKVNDIDMMYQSLKSKTEQGKIERDKEQGIVLTRLASVLERLGASPDEFPCDSDDFLEKLDCLLRTYIMHSCFNG